MENANECNGKIVEIDGYSGVGSCNGPAMLYVKAWEINLWMFLVVEELNPGPGSFASAASGLTTELPRPLIDDKQ